MHTKTIALAAAALLIAGCDFKANVYPMTAQQAYDTLAAAPLPSENGPFGKLDVSASGEGNGVVRWVSSSGVRFCEADIAPEGADKSRINVFCDGPGEGAATGMMQAMYRSAIIEHIDATLRGRAYDPNKARGETATLWPKDTRQADGSIGAAAGEALKMDREMHRELQEAQASQEEYESSAQTRGDINFRPGEPMVNVAR